MPFRRGVWVSVPDVPAARAHVGTLDVWITANGVIEPVAAQIARARTSTVVTRVAVTAGQTVNRGDLLLSVDVDVRILAPRPQALLVPRTAVRSDQRGRFVLVVEQGTLRRHDVHIDAGNTAMCAIGRGVVAGDIVALQTGGVLEDGMRVRPVLSNNP